MQYEGDNEALAIIEVAQAAVDVQHVGVGEGVIAHHEVIKIADLEKKLPNPRRSRGTTVLHTPSAFIGILNDLGAMQKGSAIFVDADPSCPSIVAILDYDTDGKPGWREHRVEIGFRATPAWKRWMTADGRFFTQTDFAEFVENNAGDIHDPSGATLLELVRQLEISNKASFKSSVNLQTGEVEFAYEDQHNAKVGVGKIAVPKTFSLALSPYLGSSTYDVKANFRYRLRDGVLTMGFKLMQAEKVVEDVIKDIVAVIEKGTNISIYEGCPPRPTVGE